MMLRLALARAAKFGDRAYTDSQQLSRPLHRSIQIEPQLRPESRMGFCRALAGSFLLAVAMLTVGCATTPQSATPSTVISAPAEGRARIVFYRPSGLFGYAMRADILLDGKKVGKSAPGTKFYVDTAPGIHHVTVPTILYSGESTLDVSVAEGKVVYVRTSIGGSAFGGRTDIELVGPPQGTEDTANLDLVASE